MRILRCAGRGAEGLVIGVDRDELNALEVAPDHAVHGIAAAAADPHDADAGVAVKCPGRGLPCLSPRVWFSFLGLGATGMTIAVRARASPG